MLFGPPNVQFPSHPAMTVVEEKDHWTFSIGESWIKWFPEALSMNEKNDWFQAFLPGGAASLPWQQESIFLFGRWHQSPRLTLWFGDRGYTYSGIWHPPTPFPEKVLELKSKAESFAGAKFNAVLLNCYRDGRDGMGWHADDEPALGRHPVIASISLGHARMFHLKHRTDPALKLSFLLTAGSCLVMGGKIQEDWVHAIPKTRKKVGTRINLTFRYIYE